MKHGVSLPSDLETQNHSLPPNVYASQAYGLNAGTERSSRSLCIPCALTKHEFKQRIPAYTNDVLEGEHTPKAWVDGRRYRMVYHRFPRRAVCADCGDRMYIVYEPER